MAATGIPKFVVFRHWWRSGFIPALDPYSDSDPGRSNGQGIFCKCFLILKSKLLAFLSLSCVYILQVFFHFIIMTGRSEIEDNSHLLSHPWYCPSLLCFGPGSGSPFFGWAGTFPDSHSAFCHKKLLTNSSLRHYDIFIATDLLCHFSPLA